MREQGTTSRWGPLGVVVALVASLTSVGVVAAAGPASAEVSVAVNVANGTIGVQQTVSATVDSSALGAPSGTVTFTANGTAIGSQPVGGTLGTKAQVAWTPASSGSVAVLATFVTTTESTSDSQTVQIARVDTASSVSTPGTAGASSVIPVSVAVRSSRGAYIPTGGVAFFTSNGSAIGSATLDRNGRASINYTTPDSTGTVSIYAVYNGDANANSSKSANDSVKVTAQASGVSLVVPQTNYVNTGVVLLANITPTTAAGTVEFAVNGKYLGTTKVSKGSASLTWVPNALGTFVLTAKYSGGGGVASGTATNSVKVIEALKADQITVDPAGAAGAWVPNTTTVLANGADVQLNATSASGLPVALAVAGPCTLNGTLLHVNGAGGTCTLTASTKGGNGFSPASQKYGLSLGVGVQTAKVQAPPSGTYARGSKLRLSRLGAVTSVNQPIRWRVSKGSAFCKVIAKGGYYKLKLLKRGTCRVRGTAPAIAGQWSAYLTTRTYRVR